LPDPTEIPKFEVIARGDWHESCGGKRREAPYLDEVFPMSTILHVADAAKRLDPQNYESYQKNMTRIVNLAKLGK
jgi:hypothetical protein